MAEGPNIAKGSISIDNFSVQNATIVNEPRILKTVTRIQKDFSLNSKINIVYLGGSITQGYNATDRDNNSWASKVGNYFKDTMFNNKIVNNYNVGIGGTGLDLGVFRTANDVISKDPEIVFVKFAINDSSSVAYMGLQSDVEKNMEGIVRQIIKSKPLNPPTIIFVYTTSEFKNACTSVHNNVANYYGIPIIDLQEFVWSEASKGTFNIYKPEDTIKNSILADGVHPNNYGHSVYSDYIISKLNNESDYLLTTPVWQMRPFSAYEYETPKITPYEKAIFTGSWSDKTIQNINVKSSNTIGDSLTYKFYGRSIGIYSYAGIGCGKLTYTLDNGIETGTIDLSAGYTAQRQHQIIDTTLNYGLHTITFTVANSGNTPNNPVDISGFLVDDWSLSTPMHLSVVYKNEKNEVISQLNGGNNTLNAELSIINTSDEVKSITAMLALYKNKRLVAINTTKIDITKDSETYELLPLTVDNPLESEYYAKVMIFSNFETIKPLVWCDMLE